MSKPEKPESCLSIIAGFVVTLTLLPGMWAWHGFVLAKMWAWFIVPQFGLAPLSVPYAIGVAITISFMTSHSNDSVQVKRTLWEGIWMRTFAAAIGPAVALLCAWVVKGYL